MFVMMAVATIVHDNNNDEDDIDDQAYDSNSYDDGDDDAEMMSHVSDVGNNWITPVPTTHAFRMTPEVEKARSI